MATESFSESEAVGVINGQVTCFIRQSEISYGLEVLKKLNGQVEMNGKNKKAADET